MARTRASPRHPTVSVKEIVPFLWFDHEAENAAKFYVSTFRGSRIIEVGRTPAPRKGAKGRVLTVSFRLAGQPVLALNGGPGYPPTPAFSFFVRCSTQAQVDALWKRLTLGGSESRCGWLQDRFGVSWQIIPNRLPELLGDPDPGRAARALAAMLKMKKIDIRILDRAADGPGG